MTALPSKTEGVDGGTLGVVLEHRFRRTPDGRVWSPMFGYAVWQRYLAAFAQVAIIARVLEVASVDESYRLVLGDRVSLLPVPYYHGPAQYLRQRGAVRRALADILSRSDFLMLRLPSNLARLAAEMADKRDLPYGVELVADPWDMFSPGAVKHPLRFAFRRLYTRNTQRLCQKAAGVLYVTERCLQIRYPAAADALSVGVSDVELAEGSFVPTPRSSRLFESRPFRLISVGMFNLLYKAQDVLVHAVAELRRDIEVELIFVGDGIYLPSVRQLAEQLGLRDKVVFRGQVAGGAPIRDALDGADLFVMPSRQEGLPRAMVEAMARGLPVVGSHVGGIPELLPIDEMVEAGNARALAKLLRSVISDPVRLAAMSARNLARAREFLNPQNEARRNEFYRAMGEAGRRKNAPEGSAS